MGRKKTPHFKRRMIGFSDMQYKILEKLADKSGISVSELVRRVVDDYFERLVAREEERKK